MVRGVGLVLVGMWGGIVGCSGVWVERGGGMLPPFFCVGGGERGLGWGGCCPAVVVIIVWV